MTYRRLLAFGLHARKVLLASVAAAGLATVAVAVPPRGSDAAPIALKNLDGAVVRTADLGPGPIVLIFGELHHDGVKRVCAEALEALAESSISEVKPSLVLVVAEDLAPAKLKAEAEKGKFPSVILHDPRREAFAAYHIVSVPTVVIADQHGKVVYAMPGFVQRFKEILSASILVGAGKKTSAELDLVLDPSKTVPDAKEDRVARLVHLGKELARHGLFDMAEARFAEALSLDPANVGAQLGLGELLLRQDRLTDAEPVFRGVLTKHPESLDAQLGMATVQVLKGGDDLPKAEALVQAVLAKDPKVARARYLLGRVLESRGDSALAMAEYRKAAEIAMDTTVPPVGTLPQPSAAAAGGPKRP